jgi:hypothetical protein
LQKIIDVKLVLSPAANNPLDCRMYTPFLIYYAITFVADCLTKKIIIMKEYLLLLRGGIPVTAKTDAENKAELQAWGAYMGGLVQSGSFVGGLPLVSGGKVVSASGVSGEPVISSKEGIVGGYLIIKADSLEKAAELAKGCPHISNEGNIEVREIAPMPAM